MTSDEIRTEVSRHAPTPHCIWPNGLGYNWRGWEYSYSHRGWFAWCDNKQGWGANPEEAKNNATVVEIG